MKEYINYYYQIMVQDLRLIDGKYFFHDQKYRYMLEPFYLPIDRMERLYQLNMYLKDSSAFYHEIIKNVQGAITTPIENKNYVLLKLSPVLEEKISIFDLKVGWEIAIPRNKKFMDTHFPWFRLWENKIDYFENSFMVETEDFSYDEALLEYFVGLGENAIQYLKESLRMINSIEELPLRPSHRRVSFKMSLIEFYNPLNIIIDIRARDIAEYLKTSFWSEEYNTIEIENFLDQVQFTKIEAQLFFSRLLFPSFYFDYLENRNLPKNFEIRIGEYQFFITDIYYYLRDKYSIEEIKWLKKKT